MKKINKGMKLILLLYNNINFMLCKDNNIKLRDKIKDVLFSIAPSNGYKSYDINFNDNKDWLVNTIQLHFAMYY